MLEYRRNQPKREGEGLPPVVTVNTNWLRIAKNVVSAIMFPDGKGSQTEMHVRELEDEIAGEYWQSFLHDKEQGLIEPEMIQEYWGVSNPRDMQSEHLFHRLWSLGGLPLWRRPKVEEMISKDNHDVPLGLPIQKELHGDQRRILRIDTAGKKPTIIVVEPERKKEIASILEKGWRIQGDQVNGGIVKSVKDGIVVVNAFAYEMERRVKRVERDPEFADCEVVLFPDFPMQMYGKDEEQANQLSWLWETMLNQAGTGISMVGLVTPHELEQTYSGEMGEKYLQTARVLVTEIQSRKSQRAVGRLLGRNLEEITGSQIFDVSDRRKYWLAK